MIEARGGVVCSGSAYTYIPEVFSNIASGGIRVGGTSISLIVKYYDIFMSGSFWGMNSLGGNAVDITSRLPFSVEGFDCFENEFYFAGLTSQIISQVTINTFAIYKATGSSMSNPVNLQLPARNWMFVRHDRYRNRLICGTYQNKLYFWDLDTNTETFFADVDPEVYIVDACALSNNVFVLGIIEALVEGVTRSFIASYNENGTFVSSRDFGMSPYFISAFYPDKANDSLWISGRFSGSFSDNHHSFGKLSKDLLTESTLFDEAGNNGYTGLTIDETNGVGYVVDSGVVQKFNLNDPIPVVVGSGFPTASGGASQYLRHFSNDI